MKNANPDWNRDRMIDMVEQQAQALESKRQKLQARISRSRAAGHEPGEEQHQELHRLARDRAALEHLVFQLRSDPDTAESRRRAA